MTFASPLSSTPSPTVIYRSQDRPVLHKRRALTYSVGDHLLIEGIDWEITDIDDLGWAVRSKGGDIATIWWRTSSEPAGPGEARLVAEALIVGMDWRPVTSQQGDLIDLALWEAEGVQFLTVDLIIPEPGMPYAGFPLVLDDHLGVIADIEDGKIIALSVSQSDPHGPVQVSVMPLEGWAARTAEAIR
jgi:hypothetical protein